MRGSYGMLRPITTRSSNKQGQSDALTKSDRRLFLQTTCQDRSTILTMMQTYEQFGYFQLRSYDPILTTDIMQGQKHGCDYANNFLPEVKKVPFPFVVGNQFWDSKKDYPKELQHQIPADRTVN